LDRLVRILLKDSMETYLNEITGLCITTLTSAVLILALWIFVVGPAGSHESSCGIRKNSSHPLWMDNLEAAHPNLSDQQAVAARMAECERASAEEKSYRAQAISKPRPGSADSAGVSQP
jgi:hypothetical protein